jgi:hypothetical protein
LADLKWIELKIGGIVLGGGQDIRGEPGEEFEDPKKVFWIV